MVFFYLTIRRYESHIHNWTCHPIFIDLVKSNPSLNFSDENKQSCDFDLDDIDSLLHSESILNEIQVRSARTRRMEALTPFINRINMIATPGSIDSLVWGNTKKFDTGEIMLDSDLHRRLQRSNKTQVELQSDQDSLTATTPQVHRNDIRYISSSPIGIESINSYHRSNTYLPNPVTHHQVELPSDADSLVAATPRFFRKESRFIASSPVEIECMNSHQRLNFKIPFLSIKRQIELPSDIDSLTAATPQCWKKENKIQSPIEYTPRSKRNTSVNVDSLSTPRPKHKIFRTPFKILRSNQSVYLTSPLVKVAYSSAAQSAHDIDPLVFQTHIDSIETENVLLKTGWSEHDDVDDILSYS